MTMQQLLLQEWPTLLPAQAMQPHVRSSPRRHHRVGLGAKHQHARSKGSLARGPWQKGGSQKKGEKNSMQHAESVALLLLFVVVSQAINTVMERDELFEYAPRVYREKVIGRGI